MAKISQRATLTFDTDQTIGSIKDVLSVVADKFPRARVLNIYSPPRDSDDADKGIYQITVEVAF